MSMIDMLKKRSAENVNKQIEESKTSEGNTGFAEEIQMKNLYDTKAKGKDIGFVRMRLFQINSMNQVNLQKTLYQYENFSIKIPH